MNVKNKKSKLERDFGRIESRKRIILHLPYGKQPKENKGTKIFHRIQDHEESKVYHGTKKHEEFKACQGTKDRRTKGYKNIKIYQRNIGGEGSGGRRRTKDDQETGKPLPSLLRLSEADLKKRKLKLATFKRNKLYKKEKRLVFDKVYHPTGRSSPYRGSHYTIG